MFAIFTAHFFLETVCSESEWF